MALTVEIFQNVVKTNTLKSVQALTNALSRRHFKKRLKQYSYTIRPNQDLHPLLGINQLKFSDTMQIPNPRKTVILGGFFNTNEEYRYAVNIAGACKASGLQFAVHNITDFDCTLSHKIAKVYSRIQKKASAVKSCKPSDSLQYSAWMKVYSALLAPFFSNMPETISFVALNPLCAHAAVNCGIKKVYYIVDESTISGVNIIDGAVHSCMTLCDYYAIRSLHNLTLAKEVVHIPDSKMLYSGRIIDHTMAISIEKDSQRRLSRLKKNLPLRIMISVDSEGKINDSLLYLLNKLLPYVEENRASVYMNLNDHRRLLEFYRPVLGKYGNHVTGHTEIKESSEFLERSILKTPTGLHFFLHEERISALYAENLLCRFADVAVMNPSGAAMYPVPKIVFDCENKSEQYFSKKAFAAENAMLSCMRGSEIFSFLKNCIEDNSYLVAANKKIFNARLKYQGTLRLVEQINRKAQLQIENDSVEESSKKDMYKFLRTQ